MTTLADILKAAVEFNAASAEFLEVSDQCQRASEAILAAERDLSVVSQRRAELLGQFEAARSKFVQLVGNRSSGDVLRAALLASAETYADVAAATGTTAKFREFI